MNFTANYRFIYCLKKRILNSPISNLSIFSFWRSCHTMIAPYSYTLDDFNFYHYLERENKCATPSYYHGLRSWKVECLGSGNRFSLVDGGRAHRELGSKSMTGHSVTWRDKKVIPYNGWPGPAFRFFISSRTRSPHRCIGEHDGDWTTQHEYLGGLSRL